MSRDGDTALDGQAMRVIAKEGRAAALTNAVQHDGEGWTKRTPWHWQRRLDGELLDYWPTKQKWRWDEQTYHGNDLDLARFITDRG